MRSVSPLDIINEALDRNAQSIISLNSMLANERGQQRYLRMYNTVITDIKNRNIDFEFNDYRQDVTLEVNNPEIPLTGVDVEWDTDVIKEVKFKNEANNTKPKLAYLHLDEADTLEFNLNGQSKKPVYFYIENNKLKVTPTPDAAYEMTVIYQGVIEVASESNLSVTAILPERYIQTIVQGIYAYLLDKDGDERGFQLQYNIFETKYLEALNRKNRFTAIRKGRKIYRKKSKRADRRY